MQKIAEHQWMVYELVVALLDPVLIINESQLPVAGSAVDRAE